MTKKDDLKDSDDTKPADNASTIRDTATYNKAYTTYKKDKKDAYEPVSEITYTRDTNGKWAYSSYNPKYTVQYVSYDANYVWWRGRTPGYAYTYYWGSNKDDSFGYYDATYGAYYGFGSRLKDWSRKNGQTYYYTDRLKDYYNNKFNSGSYTSIYTKPKTSYYYTVYSYTKKNYNNKKKGFVESLDNFFNQFF